ASTYGLWRQVPDHPHPVLRRAGSPAPGGRGVPSRAARRGPAAGRGKACGRTGAEDMTGVTEIAAAGPVLLAGRVCLVAGLVSFASPCVVPLVPGYLSYLAAVVGVEDQPGGGAVGTAPARGAGAA